MTWNSKPLLKAPSGSPRGVAATGQATANFPSGTQTEVPAGTWTRFPVYESFSGTPNSGFSGSTSSQAIFTTVGGVFLANATIRFSSISSTTIPNGSYVFLTWYINGVYTEEYKTIKWFEGGRHIAHSITSLLKLNSGDYIYPAFYILNSTSIMRSQTFFSLGRLAR